MKEIIVWGMDASVQTHQELEDMYNLCHESRKAKVDKQKTEKGRRQAILAGFLLYKMQQDFDTDRKWVLETDADTGKPYWSSKDNQNLIYFNLTHTAEYVFLAIADKPIGIDAEVVREAKINVAKRFFSQKEYEELLSQPEGVQADCFYEIWTAKESIVKQSGEGLRKNIADITPEIGKQFLTTKWISYGEKKVCITLCYDEKPIPAVSFLTFRASSCIVKKAK